ncbi:MAG: hypothetical protein JJT96_04955 [Opitutales bacterium]|nr:hypothetical protein [Opitutales bacterium]
MVHLAKAPQNNGKHHNCGEREEESQCCKRFVRVDDHDVSRESMESGWRGWSTLNRISRVIRWLRLSTFAAALGGNACGQPKMPGVAKPDRL